MKGFLLFLATIAVAAAAGGFTPGLRAKFDVGINIGGSFFYDLPTSVSDAKAEGWKKSRRPVGPLPELQMYCFADKVMCTLFDDTDYIAGVQIAIPKSDFTESTFDWKKRGFTSWNTAVDGVCKKMWTMQQYFVNEEFLKISKEERLASRDSNRLLQAGGVWLTGTDKKLIKVSSQEDDIVEEGVFTEQACIPLMGHHYYYNMSTTTECTADQMYPWFPLTMNGELIATGFMTFGKLEHNDDTRDWFERPGSLAVKLIVPDGPQCLYDLADNPGVVTMHIYYIDHPWTVLCF